MMTRIGDWSKVINLVDNLQKEAETAANLSLKRFGLKAESIAKEHISKQDLNWESLDPAYLADKIRKGYSENILVATSSYFNKITSFVANDTVFVGVKKDVKDKEGNSIWKIAEIHEYGSRSGNIPARPLWKPTFGEAIAWHLKNNLPEFIFVDRLKKYK